MRGFGNISNTALLRPDKKEKHCPENWKLFNCDLVWTSWTFLLLFTCWRCSGQTRLIIADNLNENYFYLNVWTPNHLNIPVDFSSDPSSDFRFISAWFLSNYNRKQFALYELKHEKKNSIGPLNGVFKELCVCVNSDVQTESLHCPVRPSSLFFPLLVSQVTDHVSQKHLHHFLFTDENIRAVVRPVELESLPPESQLQCAETSGAAGQKHRLCWKFT